MLWDRLIVQGITLIFSLTAANWKITGYEYFRGCVVELKVAVIVNLYAITSNIPVEKLFP